MRDEGRIAGMLGDLLMRLLVICALVVGFGGLVLIGLLALVRELVSDSIFGAPSVSDEEARRAHTDQPRLSIQINSWALISIHCVLSLSCSKT